MVTLKDRQISSTGQTTTGADGTDATTWTIGGVAADASGTWTGKLNGNDGGGTPAVATGTFGSSYDSVGNMTGAFGAALDE